MVPREEPNSSQMHKSHSSAEDRTINLSMHVKHIIAMVVESLPTTIVMSVFTVWALFDDDIRLSGTTKEADIYFTVIISIAFFLFLLEIILVSYYKPGYLNLPDFKVVPGETFKQKKARLMNLGSFYFWLDCIATASLVFQVIFSCVFFSFDFE